MAAHKSNCIKEHLQNSKMDGIEQWPKKDLFTTEEGSRGQNSRWA